MSPVLRRNLEFRVAAQGAPRGPRAEPPIARGSGRGASAFLGLRRRARCLSATTGEAGGQPCGRSQPVTMKSRYSTFGDFRTAAYIKLYSLHVDVMLRDIFVRQRTERNRVISHQQPLPLEYCVLEGVGAVANTLRVGQEGEGFDRFIVEIGGYIDDEENHLTFDFRPPAKMVWNKTNDHSPRLDIYIPNNLSRRLIELYGTKRIDRVKLHTQIAVIAEQIGNLDGFPEGFPLLGDADHLYFRRAQCGLLSVITSLGKN
jgi:hypothetical protein